MNKIVIRIYIRYNNYFPYGFGNKKKPLKWDYYYDIIKSNKSVKKISKLIYL